MSGVINLNKFKKSRKRAEKRDKADENAVKFGRSKVEKQLTKAETRKADRDLDGHKRET